MVFLNGKEFSWVRMEGNYHKREYKIFNKADLVDVKEVFELFLRGAFFTPGYWFSFSLLFALFSFCVSGAL